MDSVSGGFRYGSHPTDPPSSGEIIARLVLLRLPRVGDATLNAIVAAFGSAEAAFDASDRAFAEIAGPEASTRRSSQELWSQVRSALEVAVASGISVHARESDGYPTALRDLLDPPAVVFLRGRKKLLNLPGVAVVGSRKSTAYGRRAAEDVVSGLSAAGVVAVSGLARGIDAAAHRAAIDRGGATIAVLGTGADVPYPRSNLRLFERIAEEGLIVTEFLPGEGAQPHHFPRRNRLIAALSHATVVVEASVRSGALITANHALDLGRAIGAVPGSIYSDGSAGTNRLLADGAHPILSGKDAVDLLPPSLRLHRSPPPTGVVNATPTPNLSASAHAPGVWEALSVSWSSIDDLVTRSGLEASQVLSALLALELDGVVVREGAGYRRVA